VNGLQTEAMLAAEVLRWLEQRGFTTYSEVTMPVGQERADIVATRSIKAGELLAANPFLDEGPRATVDHLQVAIVQCKRELSFAVLEQADRWSEYGHGTWVAVPKAKGTSTRHFAIHKIAHKALRLGVLEVDESVVEVCSPFVRETTDRDVQKLVDSLKPGHQTHAVAGSPGGGQFTTFKETCRLLAEYVKEHDGCTLSEAIDGITHHYRSKKSAQSALSEWISKGKVPGVVQGWKQRLYTPEGVSFRAPLPTPSRARRYPKKVGA